MKKLFSFILIVFFVSLFYGQQVIQPTPKTKLLVYYFHVTHRCNTCMKIEETVKKVLTTYFPNELKNNVIIFQSFNCELPENKKLVEKYQAYGSTLVLTSIKNGKEMKVEDITEFAFSKINNETLFTTEFRNKIKEFLVL